MPEQPLRALICTMPGPVRDAASALVEGASAFEVVGRASTAAEVTQLARATRSQVLVLDEALLGTELQRVAFGLALERPVSTLLLVSDDSATTDEQIERGLRLFRLAKRRLCSTDSFDRSFARTRLHLVASRARESKRTLPPGVLQPVLQSLRADEYMRADTGTRGLVAAPLDLAVVAVDATHVSAVEEVVAQVGSFIVPTLVVSEDPTVVPAIAAAAERRRIPATIMVDSVGIRRASGLLLVESTRRATIRPDGVSIGSVGRRALSVAEVVSSAASLEGDVLLVGATARPVVLEMLSLAAAAGSHVSALEPGGEATLGSGVIATTRKSLAWVLRSGVVPRRV